MRESAEALVGEFGHWFEKMPCGVVVAYTSPAGEILAVNAEFSAITGYTHEDVPTMRDWLERAYPDPEVRSKVRASMDPAVDEPGRATTQRIRCADGETMDVLLRVGQLGVGRIAITLMALDPITRTEHEQQASEQKYRNLFESSRDAIMTLAPPSWRFTSGNPATIQMFGAADEEDFVSRPPWEYSPEAQPDGAPSSVKAKMRIDTAMQEGSHFFEWVHRRCSGEDFPATVLLTRVAMEDGDMLQATVRDITARKRAEEELEARLAMQALFSHISADLAVAPYEQVDRGIEKALETLAKHAGAVRGSVFICSDDGSTLSNTHEWCAAPSDSQIDQLQDFSVELFGYYYKLLLQKKNVVVSKLEDLPVAEAASEREWCRQYGFRPLLFVPMFAAGGFRGTLGLYGSIGQERAWPGEFVTMLRFTATMVLQIIERQRAEAAKLELETQLLQAQKMEAIGRLAGGVAHDFNNMLCAIKANTELVEQNTAATDPMCEQLDGITEAAEQAATLTQQLLAFSSNQVITPVVIDMSQLIKRLHPMLTRILGEDVIVRTVPQRDLRRVRADVSQLEQVVVNLAINARDAMPDGGELHIETSDFNPGQSSCERHSNLAPGDYVMLAVSDTGCGMSAEIRDRVFEPFFTTKEVGQGTGLGLATVFGIVEQHNGRIEVESEPGVGSTFRVFFPREKADVTAAAPPPVASETGGVETLLVVEDEVKVRRPTVRLLQRAGYQVIAAGSGEEALAMAADHDGAIDLLITDVVMPYMNGRELAERLTLERPETRVLYTSGYPRDVITHKGVVDKGVQFLAKPYSRVSFLGRIREVLESAPGDESSLL